MDTYFPGTVVRRPPGVGAADFLFGVFSATKGLMLAQVKEITGLETSAVQNWVNRGWVTKPVDKRYSSDQLARIILLNMLRDVMKFEHIETLMKYLNAEDLPCEGLVSDAKFYVYVCDILDQADFETVLSDDRLEAVIDETVGGEGSDPQVRKRLKGALKTVLTYYAAAVIKQKADRIFDSEILSEVTQT